MVIDQVFEGRLVDDDLLNEIMADLVENVASGVPRGTREGEVLIQDCVRLHPSWQRPDLAFEIVVDTCTSHIFAHANKKGEGCAAFELADEAIKHYSLRGSRVNAIYTPRSSQYCDLEDGHDYSESLESLGIKHVELPSGTRKRDAHIDDAWKIVRGFLEKNRHSLKPESFSMTDLNDALYDHLAKHRLGD